MKVNKKTISLIFSVIVVVLFLFSQLSLAKSDNLRVWFFDVGQGDSTLIRTPAGVDVLVDGGKGTKVLEELGKALPVWDRYIDMVVLTHPDADHVNGIASVLERYDVGMILDAGFEKTLVSYDKIKQIADERNIEWRIADDDEDFSLGLGVLVDILWPDQVVFDSKVKESNDASIVFRLSYGGTDFLMTGDTTSSIERLLLGENIDSDFLHVGHHGSRYSSDPLFLENASPLISVVSVGKNSYGHPHPDVLKRLDDVGTKILRTDLSGTIKVEVASDGGWTLVCERECG